MYKLSFPCDYSGLEDIRANCVALFGEAEVSEIKYGQFFVGHGSAKAVVGCQRGEGRASSSDIGLFASLMPCILG